MLCYIWQTDQPLSPSDSPMCQQACLDLALQIKAAASVSRDVLLLRLRLFAVLTTGGPINGVAHLFSPQQFAPFQLLLISY